LPGGIGTFHSLGLPFMLVATGGGTAGIEGNTMRHSVKPICERLVPEKRFGLSCQNDEDGLESIFCVVNIAEDAPANTEDKWAMASHERRKHRLVIRNPVLAEQLGIGRQLANGLSANLLQHLIQRRMGHGSSPGLSYNTPVGPKPSVYSERECRKCIGRKGNF
jgi:hypothetical protein